jgi:hypothetical protein
MQRGFRRKKSAVVITVLSVFLTFSLALNVSAASNLIEITAYLNSGIKMVLHGKSFEPKDATGSKTLPITYKGTTYLPLRAVAEAVGLKVGWNGNTQTVTLGNVEGDVAKDKISYVYASPEFGAAADRYRLKSRTPEFLTAGDGTVFQSGYFGENQSSQSEYFNTNFEYDKFKARIWVDEEKDENGDYISIEPYIEFTDENEIVVKKIEAQWGKMVDVEIDIKDVKELRLHVQGSKSIIGEPMLGK